MATIKELQERKNTVDGAVKGLLKSFDDQGKSWKDDEQRAAFKAANDDYSEVNAELRAAKEQADEVEVARKAIEDSEARSVNHGKVIPGREDTSHTKPLGGDEGRSGGFTDADYGVALSGWCRGPRWATAEERAAMVKCDLSFGEQEPNIEARHHAMENVEKRQHQRANVERRDLTTQIYGKGGAVVAQTLHNVIEMNMLAFGGIRQVADEMVTGTGEQFTWPTFDDTTNVSAQLGEGVTVPAANDPAFGGVVWNAYKQSSGVLKVSFETLQDAVVDIASIIGEALGTRIGRKTNSLYTVDGTGAGQPRSIINASSSGVTTASATAITFREIMALIHSIDPAYRSAPGVGFMMHDNILLAVRQLQDSQNRPLYVSGLVDGMPDKILGFNVTINQSMANAAATANKTMLFGKLSAYKIRRVGGLRMYRLEERYRDEDKTGFICFSREDGNLLTAGTAPVKYMTQA